MLRKLTIFAASLALLFAVTGGGFDVFTGIVEVAHAQQEGLEAIGEEAGLGEADPRVVVARIIRIFLGVLGMIAVIIVIYAGFIWMTAGGSADRVDKAKRILIQGVIGLIVILLSYAITTFVFNALLNATGTNIGGGSGSGGGGGGTGLGGGSVATFAVANFVPEGEVSIRNIEYRITFTRNIDDATVDGNVTITNDATGEVVDGTIEVAGNKVTFVPSAACPEPNEDRFCFDENTTFNVTVTTNIEDTSGRGLDCSVTDSCESSFTSGELVDTEDPSVDVIFPDTGDKLEPDSVTQVQASAQDDAAVAVADFFAEDTLFDSVAATGADLTDVIIESFWDNAGFISDERYSLRVTVSDLAGNEDTDFVSIKINPAHCYNAVQDEDETGLNCGGSCGACEGGVCTDDFDCASGACVEGFCRAVPEISGVSPSSGAPGTIVTISGENMGSLGNVYFTAEDGLLIEGSTSICGDGWEPDQILVQVPEGAIDGPILIETNTGLSDATDDGRGPVLADFDVNDINRPGLCRLSPSSGRSGNSIDLVGFGFGDDQDDSTVTFGSEAVSVYASWTGDRLEVNVPVQDAGEYDVFVTVDGTESNAVGFAHLAASGGTSGTEATPTISFIEPETGGVGQYVTIVGSGFGSSTGTVMFESQSTGYTATASIDFPAACAEDFWQSNQITIIVPERYDNDLALETTTHNLYVVPANPDVSSSNAVDFTVTGASPTPGICHIEPDAALPGELVTIYGEGFGSGDGDAIFYNEANATSVTDWNNGEVTIPVPGAASTGPLRIETSTGESSNSVNFEIGSTDGGGTGTTVTGAYAWTFSTGDIPQTPQLVVACNESQVSAVPNERFSTDVCTNAVVYAEFDMLMDHASLDDGSTVVVERCDDASCNDRTLISGSIDLSDSASATSMTWTPSSAFDTGTTYVVTVTDGVTNTDSPGVSLVSDVSWQFSTRSSDEPCLVESVRVSPSRETLESEGQTTEFVGLPSGDDDCVVLDASDYNWTWDIDESFASIDEGACAAISGDHCAVATALAEGETPVIATENFSGAFGSGELTIDFTDPYVTDQWPDCETACIDAEIGARFNTGMDVSIESTGMVTLFECSNELCLTFADTVSEQATCIYDETGECTEVFVNYTGSLNENAYYRVVISGAVTSTSDIPLSRSNYGADYSWTFSTKQDNARCAISRAEISPLDVTLQAIGQSQNYHVTAYGEPDECSAAGQRLNAYNYDWSWEDPIVDDEDVAEWVKISGQLFDTNLSGLPNGCTTSCLATGSDPFTAICGDGSIGVGEECDDSNTIGGDGCSASCLREGGGSVGVCGDGSVDRSGTGAGEDCDDGNTINGDGCSSQCLNEGSRAVGAVCGNGDVGYEADLGGEDCDDGNTRSGDGCSSQCLNEGSPSAAVIAAICGDGTLEAPHESCDDSNTVDGDGCSSRCLREGSDTAGSFALCGNGVLNQSASGAGEDCDDGNTKNGDGCSATCLAEGSSLSYSSPSVCGDGETGVGELYDVGLGAAVCEEGVTSDGTPDPVQLAEIIDTAVEQVDVDEQLATASIRVEEASSGVGASTTLNLSCVAEDETQCPDPYAYGVTESSCCMVRPEATLFPTGESVCRNAAVYGVFTQRMDTASFAENAYLELDTSTTGGSCPAGHETVSGTFAFFPDTFFGRMLETIASMVLGVAQAQEEGDCIVPIDSFRQLAQDDGTYKVTFRYGAALAEEATYDVVIQVDADPFDGFVSGVLNSFGVGIYESTDEIRQTFTTSGEICTLDSIEVEDTDSDSPEIFTQANEVHAFVATPYSYSGIRKQEIEPLSGIYEWTWQPWSEDSGGVIVGVDAESQDTADISSDTTSGEATVVAQATVTTDTVFGSADDGEGDTVSGDVDVEVILCNNPWPSFEDLPFIDDGTGTVTGTTFGSGWMNFSTWYCKDVGGDDTSDDLSDVSVVAPAASGSSDVLKEYLFKVDDSSGDAIGFRVLSNPRYLSPRNWYTAQGFAGSPTEVAIDGFEAIRDGRTVYISAPNLQEKFGQLYSNIYVFSYNDGASGDTIEIFDQMIDNLALVTNVQEIGLCYDGSSYTSTTCSVNTDCNVTIGEWCGDIKAQLRRDNRRLTDVTAIAQAIELSGSTNGRCSATTDQVCDSSLDCPATEVCQPAFPTLASATFVRGFDSSGWDSWINTLESQLGEAIPQDPLNAYVMCGVDDYSEYDAATCVNQTAGTYICPEGSHVYHYRSKGPFSFEVAAELEYSGGHWQGSIDQSSTYDIVIGNDGLSHLERLLDRFFGTTTTERTAGGFSISPAFCDGSTVYGASSTCGDGIVGTNADGTVEVCEIGQTGSADVCDTDVTVDTNGDGDPANDANGTRARICNSTCSAFVDNASAACVPNSCGNGIVDAGEDCDDGTFNGRYGFCGSDCQDSSRFFCGDGSVAGGEACDCGDGSSGLTFGGGACSLANGVYSANPSSSCSWDCSGPAGYCGDAVVHSGEQCDGNTEIYDGELCDDGSSTQCSSNADCGSSVCGGTSATDACPFTSVCIAGDSDKLGLPCSSDGFCDTTLGAADGACSTQSFQTTRTKTCADGADGAYSCTWNDDWEDIECRAPLACGNGTIDEGEQCDDGNDNNTDGCTNECLLNVCGDGFLHSGIEDCDEGSLNGILCSSGYESSCSYCSDSCRLLSASGAFCGDGVINGTEFCDAGDLPYYYVSASGNTDGVCEPENEGDSYTDGETYYCADVGVCNGGDEAGELCTNSSDVSLASCSGGGSCVFPACRNTCASSCPPAFSTVGLTFEGNLLGADRETGIDLLDKGRADEASVLTDASSATVYIPACTVYDDLILTLNDANREYPNVEIMFVVDKSASMDNALGSSTRLEVLQTAVSDAATELFEAYDGIDASMEIGIAFIGGVHGDTDDGAGSGGGGATAKRRDVALHPVLDAVITSLTGTMLSPFTDVTSANLFEIALAAYENFYPPVDNFVLLPLTEDEDTVTSTFATELASTHAVIGTPIYGSILDASQAFSGEADEEIMIVFTDGDVWNGRDLGNESSPFNVDRLSFDYLGNPFDDGADDDIGNEEYLRAVTYLADDLKAEGVQIYTAILSNYGCDISQMERWSGLECSLNGSSSCSGRQAQGNYDCEVGEDGVQYAYQANTAEELEAMYEQIVDSILNYSMRITVGGESIVTSVPSGSNRLIELPPSFACDPTSEQGITLSTAFGGDGTISVSGGTIEMCRP